MSISLREIGAAMGASTITDMAQKAGLHRPLSVRNLISAVMAPIEPIHLQLMWLEGPFPQHLASHPADVGGVPAAPEPISFTWTDPGKGSLHEVQNWELGLGKGNQPEKIFAVNVQPNFGLSDLAPGMTYSWRVIGRNAAGEVSTPVHIFTTVSAPPPPQPQPPPQPPPQPQPQPQPKKATLSLVVTINLPALEFHLTAAGWQIVGSGAPPGVIQGQIGAGGVSAQSSVELPVPSGQAVAYTIRSTVSFHYDGLTGPSGVTGAEDTQVDLMTPATITWNGQHSLTARFGIRYDGFNNAFLMTLDGVL